MSLVNERSDPAHRATAVCTGTSDRLCDDPLLVQAFRRALERSGRSGGGLPPGEDDPQAAGSGVQADPASAPWLPVSLPVPRFAPLPDASPMGGAVGVSLPMPAAAIVAALDHAHVPVLPQADGAGGAESAWQFIFSGDAQPLAALHLFGGQASAGWRARIVAEGPLRQAAAPHLEALRQRLQARGQPLDEVVLAEDE